MEPSDAARSFPRPETRLNLARTLMAPVVLFRSDDEYGVLPADEVDDAEIVILFEYDPYRGGPPLTVQFSHSLKAAPGAAFSAARRHRPWSVPEKVRAEPAAPATALPSSTPFRPFATPPRCVHRGPGSGAAPA